MAQYFNGNTLTVNSTSVPYRMLLPRGCSDTTNCAQGRRAIICLHGHDGDSNYLAMNGTSTAGSMSEPWFGDHARTWADAGYVTAAIDMGTTSWFDDDAIARVEALRQHLVNVLGCKTKVGLSGISMGGGSVLAYLLLHPAFVSCIWAWMPATDLKYFDGLANGGGYTPPYSMDGLTPDPTWATEINADYPSGFSGHDPMENLAAYRNTVPIMVAHASDDMLIPYDASRYFVSTINDPRVTFRLPDNTGGHSVTFINKIPASETLNFFNTNWID